MKLSKNHIVKTAEEKEDAVADKEQELSGADVESDVDDADEESAEHEDDTDDEKELDADKKKKFDARREAATPHAHAIKDLFGKRRELMKQVNMLDDQMENHKQVLQALDPMAKHEAYADDKELRKWIRPEKLVEKKKKKLDKKSEQEVLSGLVKVAEVLDFAGDSEGVSLVENMLQIFAKKEQGMPKYDLETVEKKERKYPEASAVAPSLSTRNCPDHHGAQMMRVAEGTFQCELDGRMYNWNQGFKDYSGNTFASAPIRSVDFPDTTERMFETREMATSKKTK